MSNPARFLELLDSYVADKTAPAERVELLGMVESGNYRLVLEDHINASFHAGVLTGPELSAAKQASILKNIFTEERLTRLPTRSISRIMYPARHWAAAAAIFATVVAGIYFWPHRSAVIPVATNNAAPPASVLVPGGYKAVLTLADQSTVMLGKTHDPVLPRQGNTLLSGVNGEELVYNEQGSNDQLLYNKIVTPRGGQYRVVLPDGSKVWLNAASTLRFPIAFAGQERNVLLSGEAYFEIKPQFAANGKKQKIPFTVNVDGMKIQVLGTHFNVMAYPDEAQVRTTLLQGSVAIVKGQATGILRPGQQAQVASAHVPSAGADQIKVIKANTAEATAWKDGFFEFNGADIPTVLRRIGRWYDVEIVYEKAMPVRQFEGRISRDAAMDDIVKVLEQNDIKVRVDAKDRKIIVLN